ncbi:hypothetical protein [Spirosoma flavum]|uniref:Uncharacterized protein n=1 Tax=Spirosoma flavum TaxID=2048557 RepID=A0ABW6AHM5_9BACT
MEVKELTIFQADSLIVNDHYRDNPNYLIEYDESSTNEYCIIYFSSNDLYYPNSDIAFSETIVKKNRFEWYGNRINYGHKHIFFRDIKKQWYLTGVNNTLNSPMEMAEFIRSESIGYKLILVGSSAGGFISVILGQLLDAERIYTFNGQFEILSLSNKSDSQIVNPILYRNKSNSILLPYYDTFNFILKPSSIYYFQSCNSDWDKVQYSHINGAAINKISFKTSNHGIPFLKSNMSVVLNLSIKELRKMSGSTSHPLFFSIKMVGLFRTLEGLLPIVQFALNKIYINTIQKWKKNIDTI